ncbi:MAG TPA: hypothetical protein VJS17_04180 [Pyrinomonadaceae bacterium]|nr:hypothetical protein [Pyrinomonadaceae bacterium]
MADPKNPPEDVELRMRTLRTLWFALSMSIVLYYAFTYVVTSSVRPNSTLSLVLLVVGVSTVLIAFVIKGKLLKQASERRSVPLVQQAYVATWAITEVAALLGLADYFATGNPYFFVLFLIAAGGMLLHFPRREHVLNATSF